MIIECINCNKKFHVESSLIPESGRDIQCGLCKHTWFFKANSDDSTNSSNTEFNEHINDNLIEKTNEIIENIKVETQINKPNKSLDFNNVLSYLIVGIISFVALIIILDTFKTPLSNYFPGLELFLFNLFESLKDVFLFFENLFI
tara:strand:- start:399 stop:833 length:435 start_codon:yes stop_codon:yes gene_type:complete